MAAFADPSLGMRTDQLRPITNTIANLHGAPQASTGYTSQNSPLRLTENAKEIAFCGRESHNGGIALPQVRKSGVQDAPTSGEEPASDITRRREGAMDENATERKSEDAVATSIAIEATAPSVPIAKDAIAEEVGGARAEEGGDGSEEVMGEGGGQERLSCEKEGAQDDAQDDAQAIIEPDTDEGKSEEVLASTQTHDEPHVADTSTTAHDNANANINDNGIASTMPVPQEALPETLGQPQPQMDAVHIVDTDVSMSQDDALAQAHADVLQQQGGDLSIKTELPVSIPNITDLTTAPPFEMPMPMPLDTSMAAPMDPFSQATNMGGLMAPFEEQMSMPVVDPEPVAPVQPATGFAKLEFQDGHFYMTTYAVELGRDMRAYRVAQKVQTQMSVGVQQSRGGGKNNHKHAHQHQHQRSASVPGTPVRPMSRNENLGMNSARSFLSESGGIVGEDDGHIKLRRRRKRKAGLGSGSKSDGHKSRSTDTSDSQSQSNSHSLSRKNSILTPSHAQPPSEKFDYNLAASLTNPQQTVDPNATAPLDPLIHMPDPHFTPLIPVHPPLDSSSEDFQTGKGISRKHIRISYNFERCHFEMSVYGRNGAFLDEQHHAKGSTVPLRDGSVIQIGGVSLRFVLPSVALERGEEEGATTEDFDSVSGRMSFAFEDAHGESIIASDDGEEHEFSSPSARAKAMADDYDDYGYDDSLLDEFDEEGSDPDDEEEEEEDESSSEEEVVPKKRGPGRPPKKLELKMSAKNNAREKEAKVPTKIKLKMSAKDKARERERARLKAEAEERERRKAKAAKIKAKEAARAKAKAEREEAERKERVREERKRAKAAEKEREAEALRAKEASKAQALSQPQSHSQEGGVPLPPLVKEESKEPSRTPALVADPTSSNHSKEPSAPRIARDAPLQNGEDINVPGLPAGIIIPARKKGPGRPPKDGVMSKRERAQLIKQAKEREKAIKLGLDPSLIPMTPDVARTPKPKTVRRNSKGEELADPSEGEEGKPKLARPPRSPSPEMRIEDFSEEQLTRPSANYVYLIYEAISASKAGVMNLQQIYSAIERRYPWYRFRAGSNGWQSSVRHNLGQHEAFKKVEKEGKGWLWGIKEGVPIERERKKKSPPPQPHPGAYGHGYPPPQYPQPYGGQGGGQGQYAQYPPGQQGQYQNRPPGNAQGQPQPPPNGQPPLPPPTTTNGQRPPNYNPTQYPNTQQRPPYPPGHPTHGAQYQNRPPPSQQGQAQHKRFKPPAPEVIDTFKKVFISTYASRNDNNTAKAEAIVTNAIRRVLEPERMVGVPKDAQEDGVVRAFEGILVQASGGGKYGGGSARPGGYQTQRVGNAQGGIQQGQGHPLQGGSSGQQAAREVPHGLPATGTQGSPPAQGQSGTAQPSTQGSAPPSSQSLPHGLATSGSPPAQIPPQTAASAASHAANQPTPPPPTNQAPRPQGPAEQNLFGMLISGPAHANRSHSGSPMPPHPPAGGQGARPPSQASAQNGPSAAITTPSQHAPPTTTMQNPHAPPVSTSSTQNPAPQAGPPPLSAAATQAAQGLGLNLGANLKINTSVSSANANASANVSAKEDIVERFNGIPPNGIPRTMTPTRPAVEPLTPPAAVGSPMVGGVSAVGTPKVRQGGGSGSGSVGASESVGASGAPPLAEPTASVVQSIEGVPKAEGSVETGTKRARSPGFAEGAKEEGNEAKKVKVDG